MRVLAIGVGGAGSRIVDHLYDHDGRSRVCCMKALAIDLDPNCLQQLHYLPAESKLFFPPIDPNRPFDVNTAIHIDEVMTRIQHIDTIHIDAILICSGLGGTMVNAIPKIVQELRKSFVEPVFAIATLPSRDEGKKRSAKAFTDIELLRSIVDALILFDNELLVQKISSSATPRKSVTSEQGALVKQESPRKKLPENPREINFYLNERIARYIGLLLRAGEFNERGVEVGEVVLDAGEVLKTLTHMGIVAVGYATNELVPSRIPSIFTRFRLRSSPIETTHEKAARIVSLAKRAVYEEASIACDLTSAEKALILIAGPSHELSMRGFQAVRKWIDRSIRGLEMRSGDYPVRNTRFIGIIIVLAGLHNIPRIEELKRIYEEVTQELPYQLPLGIQEAHLIGPQAPILPSPSSENISIGFKPSIPDSVIESLRPIIEKLSKVSDRISSAGTPLGESSPDHTPSIVSSVKKIVKKRNIRRKARKRNASRIIAQVEKIVDFTHKMGEDPTKENSRRSSSEEAGASTSEGKQGKEEQTENDFGINWLE